MKIFKKAEQSVEVQKLLKRIESQRQLIDGLQFNCEQLQAENIELRKQIDALHKENFWLTKGGGNRNGL